MNLERREAVRRGEGRRQKERAQRRKREKYLDPEVVTARSEVTAPAFGGGGEGGSAECSGGR